MLMRVLLRGPAGFAALVIVLAAAGSAPVRAAPGDDRVLFAQCRRAAEELAEKAREDPDNLVAMSCARPDGTVVDPQLWWPAAPSRPAPIPALTAGRAVCVTGPDRPVAGTTLTAVSATAGPGEQIVYEHQQLPAGETIISSGSPVLEFAPGDLAPGAGYRWRARVDDRDSFTWADHGQGWSRWCEFTVSANAVDYRELGGVSLEALTELGLRPDRTYAVTLSGRQQRLLRAGTDIGRTGARMTLTGPRWTDLLLQLTESAFIADEVAAESDSPTTEGTAYRALVDAISVELGGPRHPRFD